MVSETITDKSVDNKKPLPKGWKWVKLGDVCEIIRGSSPRPQGDPKFFGGDVPRLMVADVTRDGMYVTPQIDFLTKEGAKLSRPMKKGDLVLVVSGNPGLPAILAVDACIHDGFAGLRNINERDIFKPYLYYLLFTIKEESSAKAAGAIFRNLTTDQIKAINLLLPPLAEQKRIAAILSEQLAAVERARKAAQEQLEAAKALPAAYLREVFESEEAKRWEKVPFENVAILQRGHDLPSQDQVTGKYPIITSSGINGTHHEYKEKAPGVITGRSGSIGKVYYCEKDYWPHNTALFVKNFMGNYPRYIYYLLLSIDLRKVCSGSGVPTLDRKEVHKLIISHPNLNKQKEIASYLDRNFQYSKNLLACLESQHKAINKLPSALLQRAFSGEL